MTNIIYRGGLNLYDMSELQSVASIELRNQYEAEKRNFFCASEEMILKLGYQDVIELAYEAINATSSLLPRVGAVNIVQAGLTSTLIELTCTPVIQDHLNVCRLYIEFGGDDNDDRYYDDDIVAPNLSNDATSQLSLVATIDLIGDPDFCKNVLSKFKELVRAKQEADKISLIKWIFTSKNGHETRRTFRIKKDWEIHDSFYPWLQGGTLQQYYQSFIKSKSQILVLYGEPGGGKTSFIRDLICEMNLNAFISYDIKTLTSDSTFVSYITDKFFDAIVIEDADELLTSSRGEHNKVIAKILNISDGLIKLPRKKLIFTTNLPSVKEMDKAIIRPGRCFDVINFRELTQPEVTVAAKDLGIVDFDSTAKKSWTLADLFASINNSASTDPFSRRNAISSGKIGFI